jgi:hypothetical protein
VCGVNLVEQRPAQVVQFDELGEASERACRVDEGAATDPRQWAAANVFATGRRIPRDLIVKRRSLDPVVVQALAATI